MKFFPKETHLIFAYDSVPAAQIRYNTNGKDLFELKREKWSMWDTHSDGGWGKKAFE